MFYPANVSMPETIVKRNGRIVEFEAKRIENAIRKCFQAIGLEPETGPRTLSQRVVNIISAKYAQPTVEQVQDAVETVLQAAGEYEAAKAYILYRAEHAKMREDNPIPDHVRYSFEESARYFPTPLQQFQFYDKYSRFDYSLGRRETWIETVDRAVEYLRELSHNLLESDVYDSIRRAVLNMEAMPSMRLLAMAGPAARRNNLACFNCSYAPIVDLQSFVEGLIISMSGCGLGFSVERQYVDQLPRIARQRGFKPDLHVVDDSSEGWADALRVGLEAWASGHDVKFDFSLVRPAGTPLKTKGGRASGPEPLRAMLNFARGRILARQGGVLRPIDAHDIMCAVGNAAVSGGVRRTALISLFDYDDYEMRHAKDGNFDQTDNQRWNANNSAVWPAGGLTQIEFVSQFMEMVQGRRGEPGIFNRENASRTKPTRRKDAIFGTNPCSEVNGPPYFVCNLSIAVARLWDSLETLSDKVIIATTIGTIQSMATYFPSLRPEWKRNAEDERLLGVDITGQMDAPIIRDSDVKRQMKALAIETNRRIAAQLGINPSAAITCNKPSGNSSQMLDCASGIHARHAPYYIRNVRVSAHSPLFRVMQDEGVPMSPENGQTAQDATTWVIHFPVKSPDGAITRHDLNAIQQCENWLDNKLNWTEHNPSVTISYKPDEVLDLMKWVWEHRDVIGGMSFLPDSDAKYDNMPYVEISQAEYERLAAEFPVIDFAKIYRYEHEDLTNAAQELACVAGNCEV